MPELNFNAENANFCNLHMLSTYFSNNFYHIIIFIITFIIVIIVITRGVFILVLRLGSKYVSGNQDKDKDRNKDRKILNEQ